MLHYSSNINRSKNFICLDHHEKKAPRRLLLSRFKPSKCNKSSSFFKLFKFLFKSSFLLNFNSRGISPFQKKKGKSLDKRNSDEINSFIFNSFKFNKRLNLREYFVFYHLYISNRRLYHSKTLKSKNS